MKRQQTRRRGIVAILPALLLLGAAAWSGQAQPGREAQAQAGGAARQPAPDDAVREAGRRDAASPAGPVLLDGVSRRVEKPQAYLDTVAPQRVVLLYQHLHGIYPYITSEGEVIHGGLPQRRAMPQHLRKLAQDVRELVPEATFDGHIIFDYESWWFTWSQTPEIYRRASVEWARQRYPRADEERLLALAEAEYEAAALDFMVRSVEHVKRLRPNATVGIYNTPLRQFWGGYDEQPEKRRDNDRLAPLWQTVDAFYPSLYIFYPVDGAYPSRIEIDADRQRRYLKSNVEEALRIRERFNPEAPVHAFQMPVYHHGGGVGRDPAGRMPLLVEKDIELAVRVPLEAGVDGMILFHTGEDPRTARWLEQQWLPAWRAAIEELE